MRYLKMPALGFVATDAKLFEMLILCAGNVSQMMKLKRNKRRRKVFL